MAIEKKEIKFAEFNKIGEYLKPESFVEKYKDKVPELNFSTKPETKPETKSDTKPNDETKSDTKTPRLIKRGNEDIDLDRFIKNLDYNYKNWRDSRRLNNKQKEQLDIAYRYLLDKYNSGEAVPEIGGRSRMLSDIGNFTGNYDALKWAQSYFDDVLRHQEVYKAPEPEDLNKKRSTYFSDYFSKKNYNSSLIKQLYKDKNEYDSWIHDMLFEFANDIKDDDDYKNGLLEALNKAYTDKTLSTRELLDFGKYNIDTSRFIFDDEEETPEQAQEEQQLTPEDQAIKNSLKHAEKLEKEEQLRLINECNQLGDEIKRLRSLEGKPGKSLKININKKSPFLNINVDLAGKTAINNMLKQFQRWHIKNNIFDKSEEWWNSPYENGDLGIWNYGNNLRIKSTQEKIIPENISRRDAYSMLLGLLIKSVPNEKILHFNNVDDKGYALVFNTDTSSLEYNPVSNYHDLFDELYIVPYNEKKSKLFPQSQKKGGILKADFGKKLGSSDIQKAIEEQEEQQKAKKEEEITKKADTQHRTKEQVERGQKEAMSEDDSWSWQTKTRLGAIGADIISLFGGYAAFAGLAGTGANAIADYSDQNFWDATANLGINLGLDILGIIPGAKFAKIPKWAKQLKNILTTTGYGYSVLNTIIKDSPEAGKGLKKMFDGDYSKITSDELMAIGHSIQTIASGKQLYRHATKRKMSDNILKNASSKDKVKINTNKGDVEISTETLNKLNNSKTSTDAQKILLADPYVKAKIDNGSLNSDINISTKRKGDVKWYKRPVTKTRIKAKEVLDFDAYIQQRNQNNDPFGYWEQKEFDILKDGKYWQFPELNTSWFRPVRNLMLGKGVTVKNQPKPKRVIPDFNPNANMDQVIWDKNGGSIQDIRNNAQKFLRGGRADNKFPFSKKVVKAQPGVKVRPVSELEEWKDEYIPHYDFNSYVNGLDYGTAWTSDKSNPNGSYKFSNIDVKGIESDDKNYYNAVFGEEFKGINRDNLKKDGVVWKWMKDYDKSLPKGSTATFFDDNDNLRESWNLFDEKGNLKETTTDLQKVINHRRKDGKAGPAHNVYGQIIKRPYKLEGNKKIFLDPSLLDSKDYNIGEAEITKEGPITYNDYLITDKTSSEEITSTESPQGNDEEAYYRKLMLEGKISPEDFRKYILDHNYLPTIIGDDPGEKQPGKDLTMMAINALPNAIAAGRLAFLNSKNRKIEDTIVKGITDPLKIGQNYYHGIYGNEGLRQNRYRSAAEIRRDAALARFNDADQYLNSTLQANLNASKLEQEGDLINDQQIKQDREQAFQANQQTTTSQTNTRNTNIDILANNRFKRAQARADGLLKRTNNTAAFMEQLEAQANITKSGYKGFLEAELKLKAQEEFDNKLQQYKDAISNATTADEKSEAQKEYNKMYNQYLMEYQYKINNIYKQIHGISWNPGFVTRYGYQDAP